MMLTVAGDSGNIGNMLCIRLECVCMCGAPVSVSRLGAPVLTTALHAIDFKIVFAKILFQEVLFLISCNMIGQ